MIKDLDDIKEIFKQVSNDGMALCVFASDGKGCSFGAHGSGDLTFNMLASILRSNPDVRAMVESVVDFLREEDTSAMKKIFGNLPKQAYLN